MLVTMLLLEHCARCAQVVEGLTRGGDMCLHLWRPPVGGPPFIELLKPKQGMKQHVACPNGGAPIVADHDRASQLSHMQPGAWLMESGQL